MNTLQPYNLRFEFSQLEFHEYKKMIDTYINRHGNLNDRVRRTNCTSMKRLISFTGEITTRSFLKMRVAAMILAVCILPRPNARVYNKATGIIEIGIEINGRQPSLRICGAVLYISI